MAKPSELDNLLLSIQRQVEKLELEIKILESRAKDDPKIQATKQNRQLLAELQKKLAQVSKSLNILRL